MQYISTRGAAAPANFTETLLQGLAPDGGLYMPVTYPHYSTQQMRQMRDKTYVQLAEILLWPFIEHSELSKTELSDIIKQSYSNFSHPAICPLAQTEHQEFIAELFHGPSLAFKDMAMQLLAPLMQILLKKNNKRLNILAATSGDTGSAAITAFAQQENANIFILFPKDRVSKIQQKQMTTTGAKNIYPLAIDGCFDDCQTIVKNLFNDNNFRQKVGPTAVNSINWARILAQSVYYFYTALALGAPDITLNFCVPTGNFGNIFAGYVAHKMGLPIEKLIIATNENDILTRTVHTGLYKPMDIQLTSSPSMDIQLSSNFERLIFDISRLDSLDLYNKMNEIGYFTLQKAQQMRITQHFLAGSATMQEVQNIIHNLYQKNNYICDPHTAVAVHVARSYKESLINPIVIMGTASPAKFPETVEAACGVWPQLPKHIQPIMERSELFYPLDNNSTAVKQFIYERI